MTGPVQPRPFRVALTVFSAPATTTTEKAAEMAARLASLSTASADEAPHSPVEGDRSPPLWRPRSRTLSTPARSPTELPALPPLFQGCMPRLAEDIERFTTLSGGGFELPEERSGTFSGRASVELREKEGQLYARKYEPASRREILFHEARSLRAVQGLGVVGCSAIIDSKSHTSILVEWAGQTLDKLPPSLSLTVELGQTLAEVLERCEGVEWVDSRGTIVAQGMLMGDLAPLNIGFDGKVFRVFDFERAGPAGRVLEESQSATPPYRAPETWKGESTTIQSEVWAAGAILFEMLTGKPLVNHRIAEEQEPHEVAAYLETLLEGDSWKKEMPPGAVADLIAQMVQFNPASRPTPSALRRLFCAI